MNQRRCFVFPITLKIHQKQNGHQNFLSLPVAHIQKILAVLLKLGVFSLSECFKLFKSKIIKLD